MIPKVTKLQKYSIAYLSKKELDILKDEIFNKEIYNIQLNSNPVIYDLGSHIGLSILYFKNKYPNSTIYAFEPNPNIFPLLEENIQRNGIIDVHLFEVALSKRKTHSTLHIDSSGEDAFSTASFKKDAWNGKQKTLPIEIESDLLSNYLNKETDLLKMDIEGEELNVLSDLQRTSKLSLVKNIIIEYHPGTQSKLKEIISILKQNSFTLKYKEEGEEIQKPENKLILIVGQKISDHS